MKRFLTGCLALVMLLAFALPVLAEGEKLESNANVYATGMPIVEEPITVTVLGRKHPIHGDWDKLEFFKIMEEKTNIHFEFETPAWEMFDEKKNVMFATDSYPEFIFGGTLTAKEEVTYGSDGILLPLNDLIEQYAPNLTATFEANAGLKASVTTPDGNIYSFPNYTTAPLAMAVSPMWVNYEWMNALGITEADLPENLDDLYNLFVRMRDEDPNGNGEADEIPFIFADKLGEGLYNAFLPSFGVNSRRAYVVDGVVKYGYLEENIIHFFEYANKLWSEKLIDQDGFAQDWAAKTAKSQSGIVGVTIEAVPDTAYGVPDPAEAAKYPMLRAFSSEYSEAATLRSTGLTTGTAAITNKAQNVEAIVRWIDYLYSEEGSMLIHYGPVDNLYKVLDNGLYEYIIPEDGRGTEEKRGGELTPDCGLALPKWVRPDTETNWNSPLQQQRAAQVDAKLWPYAVLPLPNLYYTLEEQQELDIIETDLKKYEDENAAKFITGDASLEDYQGFKDQLVKMGAERVLEITQAAYDRWSATQ